MKGLSQEFPFYQNLLVADSHSDLGDDVLVGFVAAHLLAPGEHTLALKILHWSSIQYDSRRKHLHIDLNGVELVDIESEPRQVRICENRVLAGTS